MSTHTFPIYKFVQPDSLKPQLPFEQGPAVVMETLTKDSHMDLNNNYLSASMQSVDFAAKWISYDENEIYPLQINFPEVDLIFSGDMRNSKISVCPSCLKNPKKYLCPQLHHIPSEIECIPLMQRRFLSPVFLHCSLGRSAGSNPYSEYRKLIGDVKFSRNMRALKLYSGVVGAFLSTHEEETWLTPNIFAAAKWLSQHNCYIKPLVQYISSLSANSQPFPTAYHSSGDTRAPPFQERDLVMPNGDFCTEIHNEDFHYMHLMA
ncbi:9492_t:CDS:2, partial [Paraglomus occultum]